MTDRELLRQALDALTSPHDAQHQKKLTAAVNAIRARLAEPEVKWIGGVISDATGEPICELKVQRPMTLHEIQHAIGDRELYVEIVRAVEKHHGIR